MPNLRLARVPRSADLRWRPVFDAIAALQRAHQLDVLGHDDLIDNAEALQAMYQIETDAISIHIVATPDERDDTDGRDAAVPELTDPDVAILGVGSLVMPTGDNTHSAEVEAYVAAAHRNQGVGSALAHAIEMIAAEHGRTVMQTWTAHRTTADGDDPALVLVAPTGAGSLRRDDPTVQFALSRGYVLEQTERHSQLSVPIDPDRLAQLRGSAAERADGYELISWVGRTPDEHAEPMAALRTRMSVDIPSAGLEFEEERWDAARVLRIDDNAATAGRTPYTAVARHAGTGRLVAYSRLLSPNDRPEVGWQGDTFVHGDHRGHRLGLAVKLANLDVLRAAEPEIRRIHTWNAGENSWMLAINEALGFAPASIEGAWQKKLTR